MGPTVRHTTLAIARQPKAAAALTLLLAAACVFATPADAAAQRRQRRARPAPPVVVVAPSYGGWYGPRYPGPYGPYAYGSHYDDTGVRLKLRPRDAAVFVDGYYAGIVDDFDGVFQRLVLSPGGHTIEIRMPGYQTAAVDLFIQRGRTTTYHTDLVPDRP